MTLLDAAERGQTEAVAAWIAARGDVDVADERGKTALMIAAHRGHAEVARALIAAGADVNRRDAGGNTALIYATYFSQLQPSARWIAIAEALLAAGADPRLPGGYKGMSALDWGRALKQERLVKRFEERRT